MNKPGGKQTAPHVFRSSLSLCVGKQDGKCYLSILNDCWKTGGRRRARRQTAGRGGVGGGGWLVGEGGASPTMSDALRFFLCESGDGRSEGQRASPFVPPLCKTYFGIAAALHSISCYFPVKNGDQRSWNVVFRKKMFTFFSSPQK